MACSTVLKQPGRHVAGCHARVILWLHAEMICADCMYVELETSGRLHETICGYINHTHHMAVTSTLPAGGLPHVTDIKRLDDLQTKHSLASSMIRAVGIEWYPKNISGVLQSQTKSSTQTPVCVNELRMACDLVHSAPAGNNQMRQSLIHAMRMPGCLTIICFEETASGSVHKILSQQPAETRPL